MVTTLISRKRKLTINKKNVFLFFTLFIFYLPQCLGYFPGFGEKLVYGISFVRTGISAIFVAYYFFLRMKKAISINVLFICYSLILLALAFSGFCNSEFIRVINTLFKDYFPILGLILFADIWYSSDASRFIRVGIVYFGLFGLLSTLSFFFQGELVFDSVYISVYFWGPKNSVSYCFFPAAMLIGLRSIREKRTIGISELLFFSFYLVMIIGGKNGMGVLLFALFGGGLLFCRKRWFSRILCSTWYTVMLPILYCVLTYLMLVKNNAFFYTISALFLNKGKSFNDRRIIWDDAIAQIKTAPIYGKGPFAIASKLNGVDWYSHNGLLDVALKIGLVGVILLFALLIFALRRIRKSDCKEEMAWLSYILLVFIMFTFMDGSYISYRYSLLFGLIEGLYCKNRMGELDGNS